MRTIKFNKSSAFEKEITCPYCRSVFMFNYHDIYNFINSEGYKCQAVNCYCCNHIIDLSEYQDLPYDPYAC